MPKESNTLFFASLKQEILPAIIENARGHDRTLRFWSAGCYTGEEPYALAMILADLLGSDLNQFQIKIFATDNDRAVLTIAREAYYDAKILSDLPEKYTTRFFEQNERGYRVMRAIRELIIFGMHDLEHDVPFSDIDVLMCRHHLPSFSPEQPEQQHPLFSRFAFALAPRIGNAQHMALYFNNITEQTLFKQANLKQAQFLENLTSANTYLAAENTDLVDANQQLRDASQAMLTCYEQLQEQIIQEQLIIEEMTTVQEELQATLDARELIIQELNQQDTEYSRRLSALQVIVDQQINQALAIYDIETSAPLISSLAFREIVAAMHSKSPTDLVDLRWPQMFVTNSDKEARYAWQTALHSHQPQHFLSRKRVMTSNIQEQCWEWTLTPLLEKEEQARAHFVLATVIEQTEPMRHEQEPLR